jgi:hypothetical protein
MAATQINVVSWREDSARCHAVSLSLNQGAWIIEQRGWHVNSTRGENAVMARECADGHFLLICCALAREQQKKGFTFEGQFV